MANLGNFLSEYSNPLTWILSTVVFLGFMKGIYVVFRSIWKYFKRGVYDI